MDTDFFQISPVSIAPLAELMFSMVITFYFFSIREKTVDTWLVTVHSCITTCMFAANFFTTATVQSAVGPGIEKLQYIFVASLSLFNVLFAYLFGNNPFKKEMVGSFTVLLLLFGTALYVDRIAFPYALPAYVLASFIIISVFARKAVLAHKGAKTEHSPNRESRAYRGFALCFLFYFLINLIGNLGVAGIIPPWWMLLVQLFIYAYLFTFFISYLNYTRASVSFITKLEGVLLYINLMVLGALGLLMYGVEMPDKSGRHALNILAALIPLTTLGIVIFVPFFFRSNLLRPLRSILEGVKRVDAGDLSFHVTVTTNDEIGTLTESFNRMTNSLRVYASQMESLVAARTAQLNARQKELENTLKELEDTQHELQKATAQKNRFFDNITHEFKTPLTLILAPLENLSTSPLLADEVGLQALHMIERNAKHLLSLVNQLLDLSKIESGDLVIRETPGVISAVTAMVVEDFQAFAAQKEILIKYENLIPEGPVLFDHERWVQIAGNLLSNAIKFCPNGGMVSVNTFLSAGTQAVLSVSDTGIGIPENEIGKIFDRFYQSDTSRAGNYPGTGLGLALVKELCNLMHGKIEVQSVPGKRTAFTVHIPVRIPSQNPIRVLNPENLTMHQVRPEPFFSDNISPAGKGLPDGKPHNKNLPLLLIVEDNEELLEFLRALFIGQYNVITAVNGKDGLLIASKELPDVVISDVMMPEVDGFGFLKALKEDIRTSHIGVILLTAKSNDKSRIEGFMSGADQYLEKPFFPTELKLRLRNLLKTQERIRQNFKLHFAEENIPIPETGPASSFVKKLFDLVENHLDSSQLNPEMLAAEMAVSVRTLTRKLSTLTGLAPAGFIRDYRLKKAAELLKSGKAVAEVAYSTGFENPSYFATAFKAHFHCTPTAYQRQQTGTTNHVP